MSTLQLQADSAGYRVRLVTDDRDSKGGSVGSTSLGLLERAKRREPGAWEQIVQLYSPLVYAWCRRRWLRAADAEDVGQEVFRVVFRKLGDFRKDRAGDSFRGWLHSIVKKKILDHHRKNRPALAAQGGSDAQKQLEQIRDPAADAEADSAMGEEDRPDDVLLLFRQALKQLQTQFKEQTWLAFWRVVVDGVAPDSVAKELGISANAVYLAKSRVLRRFREEFADLVQTEKVR